MLYKKLKEYADKNVYPMHMPGHKQNCGFLPREFPLNLDITEIDGFDDLHNPTGVIKETANLASTLYKSRESFLLINGTTVGILAAIGAHTKCGDKILAGDNCHVSTPNAAELFGLDIIYLNLDADENSGVPCSVTPESVEEALNANPDVKLVIITSPSYEGVVSDVSSIAKVAHSFNIPLIVDCAHGAHLGFSSGFPESHINSGADIVVVSLHKTLPALTQCSLLHICSDRVDAEKTKRLLSMLQTTSPSYVLMASIDYCLNLLKENSNILFSEYEKRLHDFGDRVKGLINLKILYYSHDELPSGFYEFDKSKIVIITKNSAWSGAELAYILRSKYKIEIERICDTYVIAMTSICDTSEGFNRLANALCEIDKNIM